MSLKSIEGASSSRPSWKYDVFVSFRGEDTRKNFTGHLCSALERKGINFFRDEDKLERGKPISQELLKAIEASRFSIVVFSTNYAESSWCLDELLKIVECMKEIDQTVVPIFYDVKPTDVRKQTGIFGKAFDEHEKAFGAEKVAKWRAALTEVANLSGHDLQDGHHASFIQNIVEDIWTRLSLSFSIVTKGLVGMESPLEEMISYLNMGLYDVRIIGICGMGGIGKTIIAKVIYDMFSHKFGGSSFLSNVKEAHKIYGLDTLQGTILSQTLMVKDINALHVNKRYCKWMRNLRVLVVLDDVDELEQLKRLVGDHEWFGPGSRIIITTRDEHLLIAHPVDIIYKANCLDTEGALQLFSVRAFNQNHPFEDFVELSKDIVSYADGLPLALVILGSYLCGRSINEWKSALKKLRETPKKEIFDILKISYDSLDETEKKIFLDISCLFNLKKTKRVIEILDACEFYPQIGLRVLIDKSLVSITKIKENECLEIHSLLQEMARFIVCQESPKEPGKRSRLWLFNDIYHVLKKKTATEAVEVICLSSVQSKEITLDADAFVGMNNLRLLKIHDVRLPKGLNFLPNELRILKWHGYPLKSFPSNFMMPEKLVELDMSHSGIQLLWKERVHLGKLKVIKLTHSRKLTRISDFRGFPNLERLVLKGCTSLYEVHPSIGDLQRLILLNLKDCESLQSLPRRVSGWRSLKFLLLLGCSNIEKLPENLGDCEELEELDAGKTAIREAPSSIVTLKNLRKLSFHGCKRQTLKRKRWHRFLPLLIGGGPISRTFSLPSQIAGLLSLTDLDLSYCNLSAIPRDIGDLSALSHLNLSGNEFVSLPASFNQLSGLIDLDLVDCKKLQTLSELPSSIGHLKASNCSSLETLIAPLVSLNGRGFFLENCFRLLENRGDEGVALSFLKQYLLFLTKIRIQEIFLHFIDSSEKQESNDPHIARLAEFICSQMSHLPQQVYSLMDNDDISCLSIFLPGSSISDWFTFRSTTNWITVKLPSNWNSDCTFLGLAVCVTFGVKEHKRQQQKKREREGVVYDYKVHYSSGYVFWNAMYIKIEREALPASDHRWLFLLPRTAPEINQHTFNGYFSTNDPCFEFKEYGVRAVYLKDIEFVETVFQGLNVPRLEDIIQLTQPQPTGSTIFYQSHDVHYSDTMMNSGSDSSDEDSEDILENREIN